MELTRSTVRPHVVGQRSIDRVGNSDEIEFKTAIGTNAMLSSICDGDLSVGLMQATKLFESACGGIIL